MKKSLSALIFAYIIGIIPFPILTGCNIGCGEKIPDKLYSIDSLIVELLSIKKGPMMDTSYYYPHDSVYIKIEAKPKLIVSINKFNYVSYPNAAYAWTDCAKYDSQDILSDNIQNIQFITNDFLQFNDSLSFQSKSEITNLFYAYNQDTRILSPIEQYIVKEKTPSFQLPLLTRIYFQPKSPKTLDIKIKITLKSGKIFEYKNIVLKIK